MRALVFTGPGAMELRDVEEPEAGTSEVVLDVRAAGICGSELHGFRAVGDPQAAAGDGHEFAGTTPDGRQVVAIRWSAAADATCAAADHRSCAATGS